MSDPFEEYDQKLMDIVHEYGWAVQYVMADKDHPSFSYTVGMSTFNAPELLIFGIPADTARNILNDMGAAVRDGKRFKSGDRTTEFLANGMELAFIQVDDSTQDLTMANRMFIAAAPVPALQVVWPDKGGRYPWELGWDMGPVIQPLRGTPPEN